MRVIFLAAGKSTRMYKRIKKNKCLIKINKKPLIKHLIEEVKNTGINKISIVTGFRSSYLKKELKDQKNIDYIFNKKYNSTEMLYSLILGLKKYDTDIIISYTDILFNKEIIKKIIKNRTKNITLPILKNWKRIWKIRNMDPLKDGETLFIDKKNFLKSIGDRIKNLNIIKYQYMGLILIPKNQRKRVISAYKEIKNDKKMHATSFLNYLIYKKFLINSVIVSKGWYEFDNYEDYVNYKKKYN
tara:strand:+ start:470 stop:1198 length:729 start_codon:yes stop_codon:yes gene_type:complete